MQGYINLYNNRTNPICHVIPVCKHIKSNQICIHTLSCIKTSLLLPFQRHLSNTVISLKYNLGL